MQCNENILNQYPYRSHLVAKGYDNADQNYLKNRIEVMYFENGGKNNNFELCFWENLTNNALIIMADLSFLFIHALLDL